MSVKKNFQLTSSVKKYFQLTSWIEEESCQNIRPTFYHELVTWASLDMEEQCLKPSGEKDHLHPISINLSICPS